jgi:DNA-binding MarR family transcriptional regulator
MDLRDELLISKPLQPGHEVALAVLLTREYASWFMDQRIFKPSGISDQQFNVLRILRGGPKEGYLICEIKRRMIFRNADVPRLIDRLAKQGLVRRRENPADRRGTRIQLTPKGLALAERVDPLHNEAMSRIAGTLDDQERRTLVDLLGRLRVEFQTELGEGTKAEEAAPKPRRTPGQSLIPKLRMKA